MDNHPFDRIFGFILSQGSRYSFIAGAALGCIFNYLAGDLEEYPYIWHAIILFVCSVILYFWADRYKKKEAELIKDNVPIEKLGKHALKCVRADTFVGRLVLSLFVLLEAALIVFFIVVLIQIATKTGKPSEIKGPVQENVHSIPAASSTPDQIH